MTDDCCSNNKVSLSNFDKEGLICYCFKKSKQELFRAVKNNSEESFIEEVKAKMKDPGCFCEKANPSGKCCLSDITHFIKLAKSTHSGE